MIMIDAILSDLTIDAIPVNNLVNNFPDVSAFAMLANTPWVFPTSTGPI